MIYVVTNFASLNIFNCRQEKNQIRIKSNNIIIIKLRELNYDPLNIYFSLRHSSFLFIFLSYLASPFAISSALINSTFNPELSQVNFFTPLSRASCRRIKCCQLLRWNRLLFRDFVVPRDGEYPAARRARQMWNVTEKRRDRHTYRILQYGIVMPLLYPRDPDVFTVGYIQYRARSDVSFTADRPYVPFNRMQPGPFHPVRRIIRYSLANSKNLYWEILFGAPKVVRLCARARSPVSRKITRVCICLATHSAFTPFPNFTLGFLMLENCVVLFHQVLRGQNLIYLNARRVLRGADISEKSPNY